MASEMQTYDIDGIHVQSLGSESLKENTREFQISTSAYSFVTDVYNSTMNVTNATATAQKLDEFYFYKVSSFMWLYMYTHASISSVPYSGFTTPYFCLLNKEKYFLSLSHIQYRLLTHIRNFCLKVSLAIKYFQFFTYFSISRLPSGFSVCIGDR